MKTGHFFGHLFFNLFIFLGCSQEIGIAHDTDSREERTVKFVAESDSQIDHINTELISIQNRILALPKHSSSIEGAELLLQKKLDELLQLQTRILESEEYVVSDNDRLIISENSVKIDSVYTYFATFLEPPPESSSMASPGQQSSVVEIVPSSGESSSEIGVSSSIISSSSALSSQNTLSSSSEGVNDLEGSSENSAPVFQPLLAQLSDTTQKGAELTIPLTATDAQGDSISWNIKSDAVALNGKVTIPEGAEDLKNLLYTPDSDFFGIDSFVVEIRDALGAISELMVLIVVEDKPDYYLNFDGDDDYAALPDIDIDMSNGLTIEFWAKLDARPDNARFVEFGNGPSNDNVFLCVRKDAHDDLYFRVYDENTPGTQVYARDILTDIKDVWVHIAMTMDPLGEVTFYKNGKVHADLSGTTSTLPNKVTRTSNFIGRSNWDADNYLNGSMDEVRIWSTVRTQSEIEDTMDAQLTGSEAGLMHLWGFDTGSGVVLLDKVTSLKTGSLENMDASAWSQYL